MNNGKHVAEKSLCFLVDGTNHLLINPNFPHSSITYNLIIWR